ncbi:MAG: hypothetical protein V4819_25035 [Verrucomicrobiota bacterium]
MSVLVDHKHGDLRGAGFAIPGSAMTYKIFVRLTTSSESGSDAVTVTRPARPHPGDPPAAAGPSPRQVIKHLLPAPML